MSALAHAPLPPAAPRQPARCHLRLVPVPDEPVPAPAPADLWLLLGRVLEIIDGRRPVGQLDELLPAHRQGTVLRELENRPGRRRKLLSVHASRINHRAVELCASVEQGNRVRAMAARMELSRSRWRFTRLTML